jgi:leucyl/phenylalanyl-tRNA--protein transferase
LKPGTLVHAYANGIFPWTTNPITWWSPDPRAIIPLGQVHVSRTLRRVIRRQVFAVSFDHDFRGVIEGCAHAERKGQDTWISPAFISAYSRLHALGYAHSVEVWKGNRLAGGLYGVSVGGLFAGESMFSAQPDASKVALAALDGKLRACGFLLFEVQFLTPHLASMGAVEIPRQDYMTRLASAVTADVRFTGER